jgi:hypothetical protein
LAEHLYELPTAADSEFPLALFEEVSVYFIDELLSKREFACCQRVIELIDVLLMQMLFLVAPAVVFGAAGRELEEAAFGEVEANEVVNLFY